MTAAATAGDEGRPEHDRHDRGVEVGVEHTFDEADGREDQPDLAAWQHPSPTSSRSPGPPRSPSPAAQLADDGATTSSRAVSASTARVAERTDVDIDADLQEEHRDEQVADRGQLALDPLGRRGFARARSRPTKAPTIGASWATSASSANARG